MGMPITSLNWPRPDQLGYDAIDAGPLRETGALSRKLTLCAPLPADPSTPGQSLLEAPGGPSQKKSSDRRPAKGSESTSINGSSDR